MKKGSVPFFLMEMPRMMYPDAKTRANSIVPQDEAAFSRLGDAASGQSWS
jgi:hypothetical protein